MASKLFSIFFAAGMAFTPICGYADTWTDITPSPTINLPYVYWYASCCFDSQNHKIYVTWRDYISGALAAAVYDPGSGTWMDATPSPTINLPGVNIAASCCFDSRNNQLYVTWHDAISGSLAAAVYDPGSGTWMDATPSPTINLPGVSRYPSCCFDSKNNTIYVTWHNGSNHALAAAVYDPTGSGTWMDVTPSPTINLPGVLSVTNCCFDSQNNTIYVTWQNRSNNTLAAAVYDPSGNGTWMDVTPSPTINLPNVSNSASCCFDSQNNKIYVTWSNYNNYGLSAAVYDPSGSGTWMNLSPSPTALPGIYGNANCCFDSQNNAIYVTWQDIYNNALAAAVYDPSGSGTWTNITPSPTALSGIIFDANCCFDSQNNKIYVTWQDNSTNTLSAAAFEPNNSVTFPMAGSQKINNFAVVSERFNALSWQKPSSLTAGYLLQRNDLLIASLGSNALFYEDHNRIATIADTYVLTAVDALGNTIATATITIKGK